MIAAAEAQIAASAAYLSTSRRSAMTLTSCVLSQVNFTYPGTEKKILTNVTIQCSLNSRIAIVGPNGAGE